VPMRCSYYPQSLVQNRGAIREIGSWIWGDLTHEHCSCWAAQPDSSNRCPSPAWSVQRLCGIFLGRTVAPKGGRFRSRTGNRDLKMLFMRLNLFTYPLLGTFNESLIQSLLIGLSPFYLLLPPVFID
jgi:hypothetical protein